MMESLRVIPVAMFLVGITFIYAGFKGMRPIDVVRSNVGPLSTPSDDGTVAYTSNANYNYVGTVQYNSPGSGSMYYNPRLY